MPFRPLDPGGRSFRSWAGPKSGPNLVEVPGRAPDPSRVDDVKDLLEEARANGEADARAEMEAELVQLREQLEQVQPLLEELERGRKEQVAQAAQDIASLVHVFARRVVGDALAHHPEALVGVVQDAVAQLPDQEDVSITVSPEAADGLVRAVGPELADRINVDASIEGGALVRTRYASLDATLEAAEEGLKTALQAWLNEQWWVDGDTG